MTFKVGDTVKHKDYGDLEFTVLDENMEAETYKIITSNYKYGNPLIIHDAPASSLTLVKLSGVYKPKENVELPKVIASFYSYEVDDGNFIFEIQFPDGNKCLAKRIAFERNDQTWKS